MKTLVSKFLSFFVVAMLVIAPIASLPVTPALADGTELISNGDFSAAGTGWNPYGGANINYTGDMFSIDIAPGIPAYNAAINRSDIALESGVTYTLKFDAWGDGANLPSIPVMIQENGGSYTQYFSQSIAITSTSQTFTYTFTPSSTDPAAMFQVALGGLSNSSTFTFHLDNVSLTKPAVATTELISNGDFSAGGTAWNPYGGANINYIGDMFSIDLAPGIPAYNAAINRSDIALESGVTYTLKFDAWGDGANLPSIPVMIQENGGSYTQYFSQSIAITSTSQTFTYTFTPSSTDPAAMFQVALGGLPNTSLFTFHLDNVSLTKPGATTTPTVPSHIGELLKNGTFSANDTAPWFINGGTLAVAQGRLETTITNGNANPWDVIVGQSGIPLYHDGTYNFTVKAWASAPMTANVILQLDGAPYTQYYSHALALTTTPKTFTFSFSPTADDPIAVLQFQLGGQGNNTVYFDNISLNGPEPVSHMQTGSSLLVNGDFAAGTNPWWNGGPTTWDASSGALQVTVTGNPVNTWDASIGQNNVSLLAGGNYALDFDAWASTPVTVRTLIQLNASPYTAYFSSDAIPLVLTTSMQHYHYTFIAPATDPSSGFQFALGANGPFTFYVDNVVLLGPKPTPATAFMTGVRVNQTGYLPDAPKVASVVTDILTPQPWTLYNSSNTQVATGTTTIFGPDASSGEFVQLADFSSFNTPGTGYYLEVYGEDSYPFDIGTNVYHSLQYDSLAYFYQTRSGIAITMPYAGRPDLERPAGHIGVAPNLGDISVPCFSGPDTNTPPHVWTGCSYSLNVSKGWYDAGDHGKYVVNGGISVWTLLNEYERAKFIGHNQAAFADGQMNIPENANGVPDILDEARWELEFMLSMQVPSGGVVEGEDVSGMVHSKVSDGVWTGLPMRPDLDPVQRYLYPPTTAATLNMAAVAAQCARIWATIDPTFSARCLTAAQTAWTAALAHPAIYANNYFTGGGGYGDDNVTDEFYWAASELFVTTGDQQYKDYITASPDFLVIPTLAGAGGINVNDSFGWPNTQALGTISLAIVPNNLPQPNVQTARDNIVFAADGDAANIPHEGYQLPYRSESGQYYWGSNSSVLNNMILLGLAYDLTAQTKYFDAVSQGMDYLLGRNPNVKSYVSGYGENPLVNPHHRFWAPSVSGYPAPPPGVISGGPNSDLDDSYIQAVFPSGCAAAPQKCYADNNNTFSTNEVAINWNAPLAWVSAFINDAEANTGVTSTPTPTATVADTSTPTSTATVADTSTPTATPALTDTPTLTETPALTATATPTFTPTATRTATNTVTRTPTKTSRVHQHKLEIRWDAGWLGA